MQVAKRCSPRFEFYNSSCPSILLMSHLQVEALAFESHIAISMGLNNIFSHVCSY